MLKVKLELSEILGCLHLLLPFLTSRITIAIALDWSDIYKPRLSVRICIDFCT